MHLNSLGITPILCGIAHDKATIVKLKSGNYRVQIRRKGQYASKTFSNKSDALSWSLEADRRSDQGRGIIAPKITEWTCPSLVPVVMSITAIKENYYGQMTYQRISPRSRAHCIVE